MSRFLKFLIFLLFIFAVLFYCKRTVQDKNEEKLEVPKTLQAIPEQIISRDAYVVSYNNETKCPNWVAWHLTGDNTQGIYKRTGVPFLDENGHAYGIAHFSSELSHNHYIVDLEVNGPRQQHDDWAENGLEMTHGHLCPAADNKWSKEAQNQCSLLSNICPQTERLNTGSWNKLEGKCREWANNYGDIYIVAGPVFYNHQITRTFGKNQVAIPDAFFKVVLCVNDNPKAIGFIYANDNESHSLKNAICTVDHVEQVTGIDFFPLLPDEVENQIENSSNINEW